MNANTIAIRKNKVYREEWYIAGSLFLAGILYGILNITAWLHEWGHVFFAFITGGSGVVQNAFLTYTYGGWEFLINIGGVLFVVLVGHGLFMLGLKLRWPWLGAYVMGLAYPEIIWFIGSSDQSGARISTPLWLLLMAVILFFLWVCILLVGVRNIK